jgi:hypothetical protein
MVNEYVIQKLKNLLDELGDKIYDCRMEYETDIGGADNHDEVEKAEKILNQLKKEIKMI